MGACFTWEQYKSMTANMNATLIRDARLVFPGESIRDGSLLIDDGRIAALDAAEAPAGASVVDAGGKRLTPGLIDVHTHGIAHHFYERDPEEMVRGAAMLPRFGVTSILPTLY